MTSVALTLEDRKALLFSGQNKVFDALERETLGTEEVKPAVRAIKALIEMSQDYNEYVLEELKNFVRTESN